MKKSVLMVLLACMGLMAAAQTHRKKEEEKILEARENPDTAIWDKNMELGINFNQASFTDNWQGGGVNSYSIGGLFIGKLAYTKKRNSYEGILNGQYGVQKSTGLSMRKTIDVLMGDFKYARFIKDHWSFYTGANIISQFSAGYDYPGEDSLGREIKVKISNFFAPAFITIPVGFQYKPAEYFYARFGIASLRYTVVADDELSRQGKFGVDSGKHVLRQLGMQIIARFDKDLTETVNLKASYFGFYDYADLRAKNWEHRLDLTATAKVTKYINTTFSAILIYDRTQDSDIQLSQVLNVGFLLKLGQKEDEKKK